jgi:hypothetical protein
VIEYNEFLAATMDMNYSIREDNILKAFAAFDKAGSGNKAEGLGCELGTGILT